MHLLEGAKISQQLLNQALSDPNFTFGIEVEFFLVGAREFLVKAMTQDLETRDEGKGSFFVKKLGEMTWADILHYFTPLGVNRADIKSDHEIMHDRLLDAFQESENVPADIGEIVSTHPGDAWEALKREHGVHVLMAMLRIFPEHRIMGVPPNQSEAIREIVYDGDVEEIAPFGKLSGIDIALAEMGREDAEINFTKDEASRDTMYGLIAKELTEKLGQKVIYTTDSNYVYHVSNEHEYWALTEDGSLFDTEQKSDAIGMELISPVMSAQEGLVMLDQVMAIMNEGILGLQVATTEKTGLHVNLGVRGKDIDAVKILVLSGDEYITDKFDRATSENAASIQAEVQRRMQAAAQGKASSVFTPKDLVQAASKVLQSIKADPKDLQRAIEVLNSLKPEGKKHSINFEKLASGYVEYRAIGNAGYHRRADEVRDAILHMIGITYIATDPNAYRQEFLKKLYAMIQRALSHELKPGEFIDVPMGDSIGDMGKQFTRGYGSPIDQYRDTPYDGENFVQYGFDPGSDTQ